ncbi:MAG: mismatch repair protein [Acidobacteriota bacterium]|nr:mismatch repair protein [Acidobacteriota bacterium]
MAITTRPPEPRDLLSPLDTYRQRAAARQLATAARERTHVRLGNAKVALVVGTMIYWAVTVQGSPSSLLLGAAAVAFVALLIWHEVVMRALARAQAAVQFYADGMARIEDRWIGKGQSSARFGDADHPYSDDLDVFGEGSLFELISSARTTVGEQHLAAWLSAPAAPTVIRQRQARVMALRSAIDLRERIATVNAASGGRRLLPERLIEWAETPATLPRAVRLLAAGLSLAFAAGVVIVVYGGPAWPLVPVTLANLGMLWWLMKPATAVVEGLSSAAMSAGLDLLARVVAEIEGAAFEDPELVALVARLKGASPAESASRGLARLARVSDWVDSRHNAFARLLEIPALFTIRIGFGAEAWKTRDGARLRDWVDVVGEVEALLSLAGYSYERPDDVFPEVVESAVAGGEAVYEAVGLAHPLIPRAVAVRNSVSLGSRPQVLIVSGSNMAGKSTLMRTIGLNAVLALAGAPVRATGLRLSPLVLGTCLRHTDSLREGRSGFFTEVLRIRQICNLLDGPGRVLFLFDELLSGTNSKDRRTAAEALVRMLVGRGAIGVVTTHDLALTEIAAILPGEVKNVHLQDHVENGQMRFDYKLRDGVITQSNALELMRMIGLDV